MISFFLEFLKNTIKSGINNKIPSYRINDNKLTELPDDLGNWTQLTYINLSNNHNHSNAAHEACNNRIRSIMDKMRHLKHRYSN